MRFRSVSKENNRTVNNLEIAVFVQNFNETLAIIHCKWFQIHTLGFGENNLLLCP